MFVVAINKDATNIEKTLGLEWDTFSAEFMFNFSKRDRTTTRRGLLSVTASLYDPLEFIAPLLLPAKLILQSLCREGISWDDEIPVEVMNEWQKWLDEMK